MHLKTRLRWAVQSCIHTNTSANLIWQTKTNLSCLKVLLRKSILMGQIHLPAKVCFKKIAGSSLVFDNLLLYQPGWNIYGYRSLSGNVWKLILYQLCGFFCPHLWSPSIPTTSWNYYEETTKRYKRYSIKPTISKQKKNSILHILLSEIPKYKKYEIWSP